MLAAEGTHGAVLLPVTADHSVTTARGAIRLVSRIVVYTQAFVTHIA